MPFRRHGIYRNELKKCVHCGIYQRTYTRRYCKKCYSQNYLTGSPEGFTVHKYQLKPYRWAVGYLLRGKSPGSKGGPSHQHPATAAAEKLITAAVDDGAMRSGPFGQRCRSLKTLNYSPREILTRLACLYLLQSRDPHTFRPDLHARRQFGRTALRVVDRRRDKEHPKRPWHLSHAVMDEAYAKIVKPIFPVLLNIKKLFDSVPIPPAKNTNPRKNLNHA